jgi:Uma2 family endonuclease
MTVEQGVTIIGGGVVWSGMTAAPKLRFTFGEYLLVDEASQVRHEYLDGLILGMAGGTPEHARLAAAVVASLARQLEGKRCAVFSEALRIRVPSTGFAGLPRRDDRVWRPGT